MPVFERGYTHWTPSGLPVDPPWWAIARRGLVAPLQQRGLLFLLFLAWIPAVVKGGIIFFKARAGELLDLVAGNAWTSIEPAGFLAYVEGQRFFVFLFMVLIGARLIAADRRENGLSLYFSRPLGVPDYVAGKVLTVLGWYFAVTLLPACLLCLFAYLVDPSAAGADVLFFTPLRLVLYCGLSGTIMSLVLLSFSSLGKRTVFIVVWWTVLYMGSEAIGLVLKFAGMPWLQIVDFAGQFQNAGTLLFPGGKVEEADMTISPWVSVLVCAAWAALAIAILRRQIRPVEVVT
jgi:ABC-2 type transport system permease protein